jgi:hypothetical protein
MRFGPAAAHTSVASSSTSSKKRYVQYTPRQCVAGRPDQHSSQKGRC